MSDPILSISAAARSEGDDPTKLIEGGDTIEIKVTSTQSFSANQQVMIELSGTATAGNGGSQTAVLNGLGDGVFAKFQIPEGASFRGVTQVGEGATSSLFAVMERYLPTGGGQRELIVQKFSSDGTLLTSFGLPVSATTSSGGATTGTDRLVFSIDGSMALQQGANVHFFGANGSETSVFSLANQNARILGMNNGKLFVKDTSSYDVQVYNVTDHKLVSSFYANINGLNNYSTPGDLVSGSSDQYAITSDGKFVWKTNNNIINVATSNEPSSWSISPINDANNTTPYNFSGNTIQNGGKFYSLNTANGELVVADPSKGLIQSYSLNQLSSKVSSISSVSLLGAGDDGSVLLSVNSNSTSIPGLPTSGLTVLFKLNAPTQAQSSYSLDTSFGDQGVLLSPNGTDLNVKATVGDTFLTSGYSYTAPDLNIWADGGMPSVSTNPSNGKTVVSLNMPSGSTEATFYVRANSDFINENQESIQFKLLPSSSGVAPTTPPAPIVSQPYSVAEAASTVSISIEDLRPSLGVDVNGPFEQGYQHSNSGPNEYWGYDNGATIHYDKAQPHIYNATIVPPNDSEVSQLKISVKGTGEWTGISKIAEKFDFVFGYPNTATSTLSTEWVNNSDFKMAMSDAPTTSKYYFTQHFDGDNQLLSINQSYNATTQSYEFFIRSENGHGLSAQMASELLNRVGFSYRDQSVTGLHHVNLEVDVAAYDSANVLIPASSSDSNKAIFEFSNHPPEIHEAIFNGKYIQLMFHSGPSEEINYELADLSGEYDSWRGQPNLSLFNLKVNGSTSGEYFIQEVVQKESVLLVLNKDLPSNAKVEISYSDSNGSDDVRWVIQSWEGNDALSFPDYVAKYGHVLNMSGQVLSGAELGWNMGREEEAYLDVNWDVTAVDGKIISVSGGQAVVEFHTSGWQKNPNYNATATSGLQSDPSAELVFQATLSKTGWNPVVNGTLRLSEALGYEKGYTLTSLKTILNTSSESWSNGMTPSPSSVETHDLMLYNIAEGMPFSYLITTGFNFANASFYGSAHNDFLGDPSSIGNLQINAGDGDDNLMGGFGNDRLNGGNGVDTVHVAGLKNDFKFVKTGANTFTLTPNDLSSWSSGGTDQLVSIEKVQFADGMIELPSSDPKSNTTVTALATNTTTLIQPSGQGFDYLDLTALSTSAPAVPPTYRLDADYNKESGGIWVNGTTRTYEFSGFEGYIVSGTTNSNIDAGKPYNPIKIDARISENDIVLVKAGAGLQINLGNDEGSTQDVLSFRGTTAGVTVNLEPTAGSNWVTFTTSAGNSQVAGADIVFGSDAADVVTGFSNKANLLAGYAGNDKLTGGKQSDVLFGGSGSDTLEGGAGDDVLIDLDKASLTGGVGKDQFVVRGSTATDVAQIKDLELSPEGLSRGGVNAQSFADRIIFNFSTAAFANSSLSSAVSGATGSLAANDYLRLRNAIELKVEPATASSTNNFVVNAYLKEAMSSTDPSAGLLGRVEFTTGQTLTATESIRAVKLAQSMDFLGQAAVPTQIMDQMWSVNTPLAATSTPTEPVQVFSDTVSLVFGLEKTDKFTVSPQPGEHPPVLIPVQINGIEYATRFQLSNTNEQVVGSHSGDTYQFVPSSFIDANGNPEVNQTFGNDVIIERGRPVDPIQVAVAPPPETEQTTTAQTPTSVAFDNTGRDVISLANENTNTGVSIHDLLVGDLNLVRMQKGREGSGNSLKVTYDDTTPDAASLNDVNAVVYKQFIAEDASFRVEDLQLLDFNGIATRYDLGQSFKAENSQGLTTYDARDAILLARTNAADTFKLVNTATGEPDHDFDVFLKDFNFANDKIQIEGYGEISADAVGTVENDDRKLSLTLDNGTTGTEDDYTLNLYFLDTALPSSDDQLLWLKTV